MLGTFFGAGPTAATARQLNRDWLDIELNPDFAAIARERLAVKEKVKETRKCVANLNGLEERSGMQRIKNVGTQLGMSEYWLARAKALKDVRDELLSHKGVDEDTFDLSAWFAEQALHQQESITFPDGESAQISLRRVFDPKKRPIDQPIYTAETLARDFFAAYVKSLIEGGQGV